METDKITLTQEHYDRLNYQIFNLGKDLKLATDRFQEEAKRNQEVEHRLEGDLEKAQIEATSLHFANRQLMDEIQRLAVLLDYHMRKSQAAQNSAQFWSSRCENKEEQAPLAQVKSQLDQSSNLSPTVAKFRRVMGKFGLGREEEDVIIGGDEIMKVWEIKTVLSLLP